MGTTTGEEDMADQMLVKKGWGYWMPCFGSDERSNSDGNDNNDGDNDEKWWRKGWNTLLKIKENFIGRFINNNNNNNNYNNNQVGGEVGLNNKGKFQYDPLSYALNFDEGPMQSDLPDGDFLYRDFSSRYASIPISVKSSMDLGRDGPSFSLT